MVIMINFTIIIIITIFFIKHSATAVITLEHYLFIQIIRPKNVPAERWNVFNDFSEKSLR